MPIDVFRHRLLTDRSLSLHTTPDARRPELRESVLPKPGDLVALDAEFVSTHKEEAEIRSTFFLSSSLKPKKKKINKKNKGRK